jgi:hypothetical protein
MKLARFGIPGGEKPALIDARGRLRDLSGHLADITADSLSDQRLEKIAAIDIDQLPLVDDHVRIGPPVADVRRIICVGLNYKDHAAETHLGSADGASGVSEKLIPQHLSTCRHARMAQLIRTDKRGACRNVRSGLSEKGWEQSANIQFHCQGQRRKLL